MKRKNFIMRALAFSLAITIFALCLTGCSKDPSNSDNKNDAPPSTTETIKLNFSSFDPATSVMSQVLDDWSQELSAATDGAIEFEYYPGAVLHGPADSLQVLSEGGTDIVLISTAFFNGMFKSTELLALPTLGLNFGTDVAEVFWTLYEEYPEAFKEEFGEFKPVLLFSGFGQMIHTKDKKIESPADLEGLRIRTPAGTPTDVVTLWGGVPTQMPPNGLYEALEKSVLDAYVFDSQGATAYNLYELTDYVLDMPFSTAPIIVLMRQETYDSFPDSVKKVFDEFSGKQGSQNVSKKIDEGNQPLIDAATKDVEFITLTEEQKEAFMVGAREVEAAWIEANTSDVVPAQEMVDRAKDILDK